MSRSTNCLVAKLGMLADIVAYTVDLKSKTKLALLKTSNVLDRVQVLLRALSEVVIQARPGERFLGL